ncbi:hypothetical protein [Kushneria phyllosphaerae]|uniref:hypothetical protein n=1 Tax=Kushneria phyllosphaerae TaxID=2100822 RepID=UPI001057AE77|nr:hypothetical protein [Kushneria phyllosphaerae]
MSVLLRKISFVKWEPNKERTVDHFTADAITGCTRTSKNTLSVWKSETCDFDSDEAKSLIVAMASTMEKPDTIDLVWLEQTWLENNHIQIQETAGNSRYNAMNHLHRDLYNLDHKALGIVGAHIVDRLKIDHFSKRFSKTKLIQIVAEWVYQKQRIDIDLFSDKWIEALDKYKT